MLNCNNSGAELFAAVFNWDVERHTRRALAGAGRNLVLRFVLPEDDLLSLPWDVPKPATSPGTYRPAVRTSPP